MLVQRSVYAQALRIATAAVNETRVGPPEVEGGHIGPLVNATQYV